MISDRELLDYPYRRHDTLLNLPDYLIRQNTNPLRQFGSVDCCYLMAQNN
jgi:hypothetical protein